MLNLSIPIRAAQAVFSIIVLGLSAYVANWYHMDTLMSSPSQVNFLVFVPVFSLLSIAYLEGVVRFVPRASHPYAALALECTNVLFYFAGFIALAVFLSSLVFCRGSVCASARASTVFSAFLWVLWSASLGLMAKDVFKSGFRKPQLPAPGVQLEKKETSEA